MTKYPGQDSPGRGQPPRKAMLPGKDEIVMRLVWPEGQGPKFEPDGDILMERDLVRPVGPLPTEIKILHGDFPLVSIYRLVGTEALPEQGHEG